MKAMIKNLLAVGLVASCGTTAYAEPAQSGEITIPYKDYLAMKEAVEAKDTNQYWNMTYQQILEKKSGDQDKAWELYEYWGLRQLYLKGQINGTAELIRDIGILTEIDPNKTITIIIDSGGGSVFDALNLYNAMAMSPAPIHTICDSMALSAAAVIFTAGDFRTAMPGCSWMMHEVAVGSPGGQTTEHIKWGETIIDVENMLVTIVSTHTGLSVDDVHRISQYETFYSGRELFELGVADEYFDPVQADARELKPDLLPINRMKKNINDKLNSK